MFAFFFFSFFVSSQPLATTNIASSSQTALKVEKKTDRTLQGRSRGSLDHHRGIKMERMKTRKGRPTVKGLLKRRGSWDWTGALGALESRPRTLESVPKTHKMQLTWSTKGSTGPRQLQRQPITKPLPSIPKSRKSRRNLKEHWSRVRPTSSASSRPISSSRG